MTLHNKRHRKENPNQIRRGGDVPRWLNFDTRPENWAGIFAHLKYKISHNEIFPLPTPL